MDYSKFLQKSAKDGDRLAWTGSAKDLDKFLSALGYTGTWSQTRGKGNPHKYTNKLFTCTWYETTKTLLIQGQKASELKAKLRQILVDPTPLAAAKDENETESIALEAEGREEGNEFNEDAIHDGVNPGKVIANLLQFKMKKWNMERAKVTIATPFMDKSGLLFIKSCLDNETALDKVYTREVCGWNKKKIDRVIAEAELSKLTWFVNKVVALNKMPSFHAKFLAGEYKDKVELIVTSCNMTSEHLFSDQLETVMRTECAVKTFHSDWLKPLEIMAEEGSMAKFLNMDDIKREVQNIE